MKHAKTLALTAIALTLTILVGLTATPEAHAFRTPELKCRAAIAAGSRKWLAQTTKARQRCQNRIVRGLVTPSTDCIDDTGDNTLSTRLALIDTRLSRVISRACTGVNLALLSYPGPCQDTTGAPFDTRDLELCVRSQGGDVISAILTAQYPPLQTFFRGAPAACIRGAANRSFAMFLRDVRARQGCLFQQANRKVLDDVDCRADIPPYGQGTSSDVYDRQINRAYIAWLAGVARVCATADPDRLGYSENCPDETGGKFNLFDLKSCNFDVNRAQMPLFVNLAFPTDPACGNAITEGDEECDAGNANSDTTPNACRSDCTAASCGDNVVDNGIGESCDDGNTADGDGCTAECVTESCGDGIVNNNGTEECDEGDNNSDTQPNACRTDCTNPSCGDGVGDPASGEECDDGNVVSEDGCSGTGATQGECKLEFCGDDVLQTGLGEACDDGAANNDGGPDNCRPDCSLPRCGDGVTDPGNNEQCDGGPGCSQFCTLCGDGIVTSPEECDAGPGNSDVLPDTCRTSCLNPSCGDDVTDSGEECDGEPACSDTCKLCGNGIVSMPEEECDDGGANSDVNPDACRTDCTNATCGDNVEDTGEQCDDGPANSDVNADACRTNCMDPTCGDGVTDPGNSEECDQGGANSDTTPDACRTNCTNPSCGDGVADTGSGELCDGDSGPCNLPETCVDNCTQCRNLCPDSGELRLFSGVGQVCSTNADCPVGECDQAIGSCRTATDLDSGWKGLAHNSDINDDTPSRGFLECPQGGPVCGECNVVGIDSSTNTCRCENDTRVLCDEPLQSDADDCGGASCICFFGAPFPLSSAGTPACIVNRFAQDVSGTSNVDTGDAFLEVRLRTQVFLGESTVEPCPFCGGTCSNVPSRACAGDGDCGGCTSDPNFRCWSDLDCTAEAGGPGGTCGFGSCPIDDVVNDGVRNGRCAFGQHDGLSCDAMAFNSSFPVRSGLRGGGFYSLDCMPAPGKNVSGAGLVINLDTSTGSQELKANVPCGSDPSVLCPCKQCTALTSVSCNTDDDCAPQGGTCSIVNSATCSSNADCANVSAGNCTGIKRCLGGFSITCNTNADCANVDGGQCNVSTCASIGTGVTPKPNDCSDQLCVDTGGNQGECNAGPDDKSCDLLVKANGGGVVSCATNDDCARIAIGNPGGNCTLVKRRGCFLDPITSQGIPDPVNPVGAAAFCIPPTSSSAINLVAGLPGAGRTTNVGKARVFCASDPSVEYEAGVGGCP